MYRAVAQWSAKYRPSEPATLAFLKRIQKSYVVYGDMLLLPSTVYAAQYQEEIAGLRSEMLGDLYGLIAREMKVSHVATTKPIPLSTNNSSTNDNDDHKKSDANIIRAPLNFTPLYGDFGTSTCAADAPTAEDFEKAYWVTAKQNSIFQTWSPRWTMFSRGNVSEKARVLTLPSVLSAVEDGRVDGKGCSAVDLYVGIGYFAFSYLKVGVIVVVGWDLNGWSVEGLRRGAEANGWGVEISRQEDGDGEGEVAGGEGKLWEEGGRNIRLVVFNEDNTRASSRIEQMRLSGSLPPVRHVNCGLLPTSAGSWETAVRVLDEAYDGWLHVHENFAVAEIAQKAEEVREKIQGLVDEITARRHGLQNAGRRLVKVDHINRLKSYAPGVMHCVLDIYVSKYVPG
ncbi:hypothetical protein B0A55_04815 [Friedmanniomyces simplex]|uniref:tRNA wybutosine-synthesizing protein 2 n=1 Tax=Friedmanniomyces simplex TaxID=329884 RepID=A0A4U0XLP4_9PEZI|nr:hypothetical protein B0A55_04815 [Friedmanniomyces simplex]